MSADTQTVAIAGLGAIGGYLARALLSGAVPGLTLAAASVRDEAKAREMLGTAGASLPLVTPAALADHAAIVVEALPPAAFDSVARPAVASGRHLVALSTGALMARPELFDLARETGARITAPSGAILGLDAIAAAAEAHIDEVTIRTSKPPRGLAGAPYVEEQGLELDGLTKPLCIFSGPVTEAIRHFPANVNVAASVSLAGIGPDRTRIEVWADPTLKRNVHEVRLKGETCNFTAQIENLPDPDNPRSSRITALSALAALRRIAGPVRIGT